MSEAALPTASAARRGPWLLAFWMLQIVGVTIVALLEPQGAQLQRAIVVGLVLGISYAQAAQSATWTVLGPSGFLIRLTVSVFSAIVVVSALLCNVTDGGRNWVGSDVWLTAGSMMAIWLLVQGPLWLARFMYRLRIQRTEANSDQGREPGGLAELQFGIRDLMGVTLLAALVCASGRFAVQLAGNEPKSGPGKEMAAVILAIVISNSLVALTVVTGALLPRRWIVAIGVGLLATVLVTVIEVWALESLALDGAGVFVPALIVTNAVQHAFLLASLLLLRGAGYRVSAKRRFEAGA